MNLSADFPAYLADRLRREERLAELAAQMFELVGDDLWLDLHALHRQDAADLRAELADLDDAGHRS